MLDYDAIYDKTIEELFKDIPPLEITVEMLDQYPSLVQQRIALIRRIVLLAHGLTLLKLMEEQV